MEGYVYFFGSGDMVKIGWSQRPSKRFRLAQTWSPQPVRFLGWIFGSRVAEAAIHVRFSRERIHGEWFYLTARLRQFIAMFDNKDYAEVVADDARVAVESLRRMAGLDAHEDRREAGGEVA